MTINNLVKRYITKHLLEILETYIEDKNDVNKAFEEIVNLLNEMKVLE